MSQRARAWVAAGSVITLTALGLSFAPPAGAEADECSGMAAQQSTHPGNLAPTPHDDTAGALAGGTRLIKVLRNDTDPENDDLFVVSTVQPDRGQVCVDSDGTIEYAAAASATSYVDTFTYGVTDGDLFRTAKVTVNVKGIKPLRAHLLHRRTAAHKARVQFTNPNDRNMVVIAGAPKRKKPLLSRTLAVGKTAGFKTKQKRVVFIALVRDLDGEPLVVDVGFLNTRTGAQNVSSGDDEFFRQHPRLRAVERAWVGQ